jgi:hypothetical protein
VAASDGVEKKGILKKSKSSSSMDKGEQKRRGSKTASQNKTVMKRPVLKRKSFMQKVCGMLCGGDGNVVLKDPYALEV